MDSTTLLTSFFFGLIGTGYFMYGRKAGRLIPLAAGMGLMAIPMFVPNVIVCTLLCLLLVASPAVIREG